MPVCRLCGAAARGVLCWRCMRRARRIAQAIGATPEALLERHERFQADFTREAVNARAEERNSAVFAKWLHYQHLQHMPAITFPSVQLPPVFGEAAGS